MSNHGRQSRCKFAPRWVVGVFAVGALACGGASEGPTGPGGPGTPPPPPPPPPAPTGTIAASNITTGADVDADGYVISVDGGAGVLIGVNAGINISNSSVGSHSVLLSGLAGNCSVQGANPKTVVVAQGGMVQADFAVVCAAVVQNLTGKIAFETSRTGNYEIFVMNADGSNPVNLSNSPGYDFEPDWSPDGTKIAFVSRRDGNLEIYTMNANGTGVTRVTNHPELESYPVWSPDGQYLAFRSDRTGNIEVFTAKADGSGVVNRSNNAATDCHPSWTGGAAAAFVRQGKQESSGPVALRAPASLGAQILAEASCIQ